MIITGIQCKKCNYIIYSRARHDFRWCPCETVAVDGGRDYLKITGNPEDYETCQIYVDATDKEIFYDYWRSEGKYGSFKSFTNYFVINFISFPLSKDTKIEKEIFQIKKKWEKIKRIFKWN
jgi:hypothetical protein